MTLKTRYPDGTWWWVVVIYELRGDRIACASIFFAPEFPPAEWRAEFVERIETKPRAEPRYRVGMDSTRVDRQEADATASARGVVLVEGVSDRLAVEALARRRGRDLDAEGVAVVAMGGSKNITKFLERFGPNGLDVRLAGLCDQAEEGDFRRALELAGLGAYLTRADMERLGFFVCVKDLEDELIRALGADAVERIMEARGERGMLRTFRKQPEWRDRPREDQLRRFLGTGSGRKIRSAALLVDALDLTRVPRPLDAVLAHV